MDVESKAVGFLICLPHNKQYRQEGKRYTLATQGGWRKSVSVPGRQSSTKYVQSIVWFTSVQNSFMKSMSTFRERLMMRKKLMQAHQQGAIIHAALKLPNTVPFIPGAESLVRRLHSKKFIVQHVTTTSLLPPDL